MCYKGFSIWAQAVRASSLMRPRRHALSTSSLVFRAFTTRQSNGTPTLYFQSLPAIKLCNSFLLLTIQNARGGWGTMRLPCNPLDKSAPLFSTASRMLRPQPFTFHGFASLPGGGWVPPSVHRSSVQPSHESKVSPFVLLHAPSRSARIGIVRGDTCLWPLAGAKRWETKPLLPVSKKGSGQRVRQRLSPGLGRRSILG